MNHNSMNIVKDFKNNFVTGENLKVLDIGSKICKNQSRIGTYRDHFKGHNYIGADMDEGANVDLVLKEDYVLPFEDSHFDVVVSGQTMEHMKFFWVWIVEVARVVKKGGLICLVAPAVVHEHKYPIDCWRFYEDGMRAIAEWAGLEVLETGRRETHEWNQLEEDTYLVARKIK